MDIAGLSFNSFWIGSVAVVVLTGVYTVLGGMRAVAYTEAVQTAVLVLGSLLLTVFGLSALGGWSGLRAALDPGDVQPVEADRAGRRRGHVGAGQRGRTDGVVLQSGLPVARDAAVRADHRSVVLVHRSVHRAAHARRERRARGAARHDLRGLPEAAAALHLHRARHDCRGARAQRADAAAGAARRAPTARRSPRRRRRPFR